MNGSVVTSQVQLRGFFFLSLSSFLSFFLRPRLARFSLTPRGAPRERVSTSKLHVGFVSLIGRSSILKEQTAAACCASRGGSVVPTVKKLQLQLQS